MNRTLLYKAIEDPGILEEIPVEQLEQLQQSYPWFSAIQVLLAKAYQRREDHRFGDQLQQAALYAGNRRLLYEYIKTTPVQDKSSETTGDTGISSTPVFTTAPAEVTLTVTPAVAAQNPTETSDQPDAVPTDESIFFELFTPVSERERPETPVSESVQAMEEPMSAARPDGEIEELVRSIVEEEPVPTRAQMAPVSAEEDQLPVLPPSTEPTDTDVADDIPSAEEAVLDVRSMDPLDKFILAEAVSSSIKLEVSEPQATPVGPDGPESEAAQEAPEDAFTAWIQRRARQVHYNEDTDEGTSEHEESRETTESDVTIKPSLRPERNERQQDLIDRFIRTEPKIRPGKASEYDLTNVARESLEEDEDFVTETMARLYASQGKIEKARKAYRKLMEQHPEKSVYFAAQLKNLGSIKKG